VIFSRQHKKDRRGGKSGCGCLTGILVAFVLFMSLLSAIF